VQLADIIPPRGEGWEDWLEAQLHGDGIDEVILALEPEELGVTIQVIQLCEKSGTKVSVIPFYNDVIPTRANIDNIGSIKLIQLRTTPLDEPFNAAIKRGFDILVSLLGLILLSPLLLFIAIATRLSSPGPVLFRQERVGLNKKTFTMLKFRSMRVNEAQDTAWTTDDDSRRTRIGTFLRKFSLDELPQLWNVLRGDMSLVGPRPEIPFFVEQFRETVPLYMVKNQVRPGITGWAQVNGYRGDTSIPKRVEHDLWYIENWSFGLDLRIIFKTLFGGMINRESL
jgi:Undecaprenyl-phosphate glucose phosphotransferase